MLRASQNSASSRTGFTIIEVMIVLAVAGIILLIIFLAVPTAQRSARNYDRKNYGGVVEASMTEYYTNIGHYPGSVGNPNSAANQAEICNFLKSLPRVTRGAPCDPAGYSCNSGTAVRYINAGAYTICYENWNGIDHAYIGPDDEFSITLAHWCNSGNSIDPSEPASDPIAGNDNLTLRFVIWTPLEGISQQPLCLDNFPG